MKQGPIVTNIKKNWPLFKKEARKLLLLALPIILGQLSSIGMNVTDTIMSGRLSSQALAAVSIGSNTWIPILLFTTGILLIISPTVAQLDGAKKRTEIAAVIHQSFYIAVALSILSFIAVRFSNHLLILLNIEESLIPGAISYLHALSWSIFPLCGYMILKFFSEGLSITKPGMLFGFLGLTLNIPANYALIYGNWGFPKLGATGCGYATSFVSLCMFIGLAIYIIIKKQYQDIGLFKKFPTIEFNTIKHLLNIGLPLGLAIFVEGSFFAIIGLFIASLGTIQVAAHQVAINVASVLFMVAVGIGMSITIRVGKEYGAKNYPQLRIAALTGIILVTLIQCCFATMLIIFNESIATVYSESLAVINNASFLLIIAAIFQLPDGIQMAAAGGLRGLKDTKVPLILIIASYWVVGLFTSVLFGNYLNFGALGYWLGMILGLTCAAYLLVTRLNKLIKQLSNSL